jgi:hypothetical protein
MNRAKWVVVSSSSGERRIGFKPGSSLTGTSRAKVH